MFTLLTAASALVLSQTAPDPCEATAGHHGYTLLLQENGHFVHCRGGETTEEEPVSHEKVVLQLPAEGPDHPFRYRLFDPAHPEAGHHNPLLRPQIRTAEEFQTELQNLANAPESLGETLQRMEPPPGEPPAPEGPKAGQGPAGADLADVLAARAAQAKYLGYATEAFVQAVHALRRDFGPLGEASAAVDMVCQTSAGNVRAGELRDRIEKLCQSGPGARLMAELAPFQAMLEAYVAARHAARDADLELGLAPSDPAAQEAAARNATQKIGAATDLARKLAADAHTLAARVEGFIRDARVLRAAVSLPASETGQRLLLGHFSANGLFSAPDIYQVHVLKRPSRFLQADEPPQTEAEKAAEREILVDRFQPTPRNYVDIGLAVMYSAGLPDHPELAGQLGHQQLVASATAGFNGGVLFSLEPLEFTTIAEPWAELLHFPTLIVPFTLDPTKNYFIGAGVGIFDVASIDVGVHLALTTQPAYSTGNYYGETFSTSPIEFDHVTQPGPLAGGWFVSLSVDLVGVVHLIVDQLQPSVVDVGTSESSGKK
ncbi:MAG TPA: hypothetical protein VMB50_20330 [Myxococcales bacterium]|nr:hypothetical protein [Myxococcales bacterium]